MKSENYGKICAYKRSMMVAKKLLSDGIITAEEYRKIDTIIAKKHRVSSCSIFRFESPKSLDNRPF